MKLKGNIASAPISKVEGYALVIPEPNEKILGFNNTFLKDKILVCEKTDLMNLHYFSKFKGIITSYGGILSHAAIYSREFSIPCIVGVKDLFKQIHNNDKIRLNLENGEIEIIERILNN